MTTQLPSNKSIAEALKACDWSGAPIGNKAIIESAIRALLAAYEQEPVYQVLVDDAWVVLSKGAMDYQQREGATVRTLYTHPAPSIPAAVPDYFAGLVAAARVRADKAMRKFPQPNYVLNKVAEESGEVIKAVIHYTEGREDWANVEGELIDNLAMLIRLVTEGDQVIGFTPPESCRAAMLQAEPVSQPYRFPMQPLEFDARGTLRFKENAIVRKILDYSTAHGYGLNEMALEDFTQDDRMQLAQLIGYSLSGYGELSFVSDESYNQATAAAPKAAQNSNVIGHYQGADGNEHSIVNLSAPKGL